MDSEPISTRVFGDLLRELGLALTPADILEQFVGRSMAVCRDRVAALLGRAVPESFEAQFQARLFEAFRGTLMPVPGIESVLDELRLPYCVASNGSLEKMRTTLGLTGLLPRFEGRLFSGAQVARGKPFPDLFLHAAANRGVPAARCAVVEDTPTGVAAAIAARMTVFGFCAHTPQRSLTAAGAHRTFSRMMELPALLAGE